MTSLRSRARFATLAALAALIGVLATPSHAEPTAFPTTPTLTTGSSERPSKPNIVDIVLDDMRADDLAYMPTVRELAGDGVSMQNAFSSYPLCCPARASFFSGLLPHNHRVWTVSTPYAYPSFDDSRTIATSLQAQGYRTGLSGKYLNGYGSATPVAGDGGRALAPRTRTVTRWVKHTVTARERRRIRRTVRAEVAAQVRRNDRLRGRAMSQRIERLTRQRLQRRIQRLSNRKEARRTQVMSWHLADAPGRLFSGLKVPAGWDDWRAFMESSPENVDPSTGFAPRGGTYHYFAAAQNINGHPRLVHRGEYSSDVVADDATQMIHSFQGSPFFLSLNFVAPHDGVGDAAEAARDRSAGLANAGTDTDNTVDSVGSPAAPAWLHGMFDADIDRGAGVLRANPDATEGDADGDGADTVADVADKPGAWGTATPLDATQLSDDAELTRQRAESLYATDFDIARVVDQLKSTGQWNNTIVVIWSDNGYYLGEHHRLAGKVLPYNPVMRIPMIFTGPGMRAGRNSYDPVDVVDLTATLLDFAGAAPPHPSDGHSLVPTLLHGDRGWTEAVPYEEGLAMPPSAASDPAPGHDTPQSGQMPQVDDLGSFTRTSHVDGRVGQGVRTARYLYTRYANGYEELYDEEADPLEMTNVADDPSYAPVKAELLGVAKKIYDCSGAACDDTLPPDLQRGAGADAQAGLDWWNASYGGYGNESQDSFWAAQAALPVWMAP